MVLNELGPCFQGRWNHRLNPLRRASQRWKVIWTFIYQWLAYIRRLRILYWFLSEWLSYRGFENQWELLGRATFPQSSRCHSPSDFNSKIRGHSINWRGPQPSPSLSGSFHSRSMMSKWHSISLWEGGFSLVLIPMSYVPLQLHSLTLLICPLHSSLMLSLQSASALWEYRATAAFHLVLFLRSVTLLQPWRRILIVYRLLSFIVKFCY